MTSSMLMHEWLISRQMDEQINAAAEDRGKKRDYRNLPGIIDGLAKWLPKRQFRLAHLVARVVV